MSNYTNEICDLENIPKVILKESIKFFFGVINSDFYYTIVDKIFKLNFDETIQYSRDIEFYEKTFNRLNSLISNNKPHENFYKNLL